MVDGYFPPMARPYLRGSPPSLVRVGRMHPGNLHTRRYLNVGGGTSAMVYKVVAIAGCNSSGGARCDVGALWVLRCVGVDGESSHSAHRSPGSLLHAAPPQEQV